MTDAGRIGEALAGVAGWPVERAAAAVVTGDGTVTRVGDTTAPYRLASVTKLLTATAVLVAVEEEALQLDEPAGPEGSTVRHLLAHASGLGPDGAVLGRPGRRRVYSNAGYDLLGDLVEDRAAMAFADYLDEAVLRPLGMTSTRLDGSPAFAGVGTADDLARFAGHLLEPVVLAAETHAEARSVQFPGLPGVLPGIGRMDRNDWGLGHELRGDKHPHWTAPAAGPATFGHFGASGTFLWVDPVRALACICLTDRAFGPWAMRAWPALSEAVILAAEPPR